MIKYDEVDKRDRSEETRRYTYIAIGLWFILTLLIAMPGIILIENMTFNVENHEKFVNHMLGMAVTIALVFSSLIMSYSYRYALKNIVNKK